MAQSGRPRVLLVNHVGELSGAENSMLTLARHLDRQRFAPVAAVPAGPLSAQLDSIDVPVSMMPELRLARPRNPWQSMVAWLRVRRWGAALRVAAEELDADLIDANSLTAALGAVSGPANRLPLVWHARDLQAPDRAVRTVVPRVARIAAISECVADALAGQHPRARDVTTLIYNGIDPAHFGPQRSREEVRAELGIPQEAVVIGSVGQLVPWKRQDLFIEAAAHVLVHLPRAYFTMVGADLFGEHSDYVSSLRSLRKSLGLSERMIFTGYREDVASVMGAMDLLVHTAGEEPLGRVILEAMSLGIPCVAVDACGPSEIIEDGHSGLLVPADDPRAIASRVTELVGRQGAVERMGEAARARVRSVFSADRMVRLTEDFYDEALAEPRS